MGITHLGSAGWCIVRLVRRGVATAATAFGKIPEMLTELLEIAYVKINHSSESSGIHRMNRLPFMAAGIICYSLFFIAIQSNIIYLPFNEEYSSQLLTLLVFLVCIKVTMNLVQNNTVLIHALLLCSLAIVLMISTPIYQNKIVTLFITLPLIFDLFIFTKAPVSWMYALSYLVFTVFIFHPQSLWGVEREASPLYLDLVFSLLYLIECLSLWLLNKQLINIEKYKQTLSRRNESIENLTEANMEFQSYAASIEIQSIEQERNRISREIHDTVGYTLTNISMMTEACRREVDQSNVKAIAALQAISDQCYGGLGETRVAMRALRDLTEPEPPNMNKIEKLIHTFSSATGIDIKIDYGSTPFLSNPNLFKVIYKTIQEGMTNAFRHGEAESIFILLNYYKSELLLVIRDDGKGLDNATLTEGVGFKGIQERILPYQGQFSPRNLDSGFEMTIKLHVDRSNL